jgi:hypothetical protein
MVVKIVPTISKEEDGDVRVRRISGQNAKEGCSG